MISNELKMRHLAIWFFIFLMASISIIGCKPTPQIVGLWEFDQETTNRESPKLAAPLMHRIRFSRNGDFLYEGIDQAYTLGTWKIKRLTSSAKNKQLASYFQQRHDTGRQFFELSIYGVFESNAFSWGFSPWSAEETDFAYFSEQNQLFLITPSQEFTHVYSKIE